MHLFSGTTISTPTWIVVNISTYYGHKHSLQKLYLHTHWGQFQSKGPHGTGSPATSSLVALISDQCAKPNLDTAPIIFVVCCDRQATFALYISKGYFF